MLRPSYGELMRILNEGSNLENKVNSRYAIVIAAAKRARQIIDGAIPQASGASDKALSIALTEMSENLIKLIPPDTRAETDIPGYIYRQTDYRASALTPDETAYKTYADELDEDDDYGDGNNYDAAGFGDKDRSVRDAYEPDVLDGEIDGDEIAGDLDADLDEDLIPGKLEADPDGAAGVFSGGDDESIDDIGVIEGVDADDDQLETDGEI
ncbi:MAG: DNA-directed RNA polymerase subunit omega [Clostridiales bacterium]|jgi:DNA-directed RNA polymerase subunit omega|nr:DNA-directed RNA polymerase subunit omega [Clostridiales bacterium]